MNLKFVLLLVALTGQSVLSRSDSYESVETLGLGSSFGSSEEGSIGLSSDEYFSNEVPLNNYYTPSIHGEPEAYIKRLKINVAPEFAETLKVKYKDYLKSLEVKPLPEPTPDQLMKIDKRLNEVELNRHNDMRALHGAPKLVYDEKLAAFAQNYAEKISAKMAQGYLFEHNPEQNTYKIGENHGGWGEVSKIPYNGGNSDMWYFKELENYKNNGNRPSGSPKMTHHFTQLVWKNTQKMGCGWACYKRTQGTPDWKEGCNVICNYYPRGNLDIQGEHSFDKNVNMNMNQQGYAEMKLALNH